MLQEMPSSKEMEMVVLLSVYQLCELGDLEELFIVIVMNI